MESISSPGKPVGRTAIVDISLYISVRVSGQVVEQSLLLFAVAVARLDCRLAGEMISVVVPDLVVTLILGWIRSDGGTGSLGKGGSSFDVTLNESFSSRDIVAISSTIAW
jgi:hypothetical protein